MSLNKEEKQKQDPASAALGSLTYLKDIRILLVEDNELNRTLARSVFKKVGWEFDFAEDGLEAIEKLKAAPYHLILMDVQMPEMDGYNATLKIRNELNPPISQIPIIACTAHVQDSELERCKEVGMNDYISKPFKPTELIQKVMALVKTELKSGHQTENTMNLEEEAEVNKKGDSIIDLNNLLSLSGNNILTINNIINLFLKQAPERMEGLTKAINEKNWNNARDLAHKMKSSYSIVGAGGVKNLLETLEQDCIKNNIDEAKFKLLLENIVQLDAEVIKSIKKALQDINE